MADDLRESGPKTTEAELSGHPDRECGEHRPTIGRAWCFDCGEWCYPDDRSVWGCKGCRLATLAVATASYTVEDLSVAKRDGYELVIRLLRDAEAGIAGDGVTAWAVNEIADRLERVKEAILGG